MKKLKELAFDSVDVIRSRNINQILLQAVNFPNKQKKLKTQMCQEEIFDLITEEAKCA